jgi:hypothetical protein
MDKACITLGLGVRGPRKTTVNQWFEAIPEKLEEAILEDHCPFVEQSDMKTS